MSQFRWLHLSDLHCGLSDQDYLWPNVREAFLKDLEVLLDVTGSVHAILFTGDIVQSGLAEEFSRFEEIVLAPLMAVLTSAGSTNVEFLAVPGNHDLSRPKLTAAVRQLTRDNGFQEIEDEFWSGESTEYRRTIAEAFANYMAFWKRRTRYTAAVIDGLLPGDFSASIPLGVDSFRVGVVGLNTAFLQLASGNFEGRLSWNLRQLSAVCENDNPSWSAKHSACILMTHHGPTWLEPRASHDEQAEINPAGRFAVHAFGHMHETILTSTSYGGGIPRRLWQSPSLFGLERYGNNIQRRHGYSIGCLDFRAPSTTIRFFPRKALRDANGWRFIREDESVVLLEDGGTAPELVSSSSAPQTTSRVDLRRSWSGSIVLPRLSESEHALQRYKDAVCVDHGVIRFVELPAMRDVSDVEVEQLYVMPHMSEFEIHPDTPPLQWPPRVNAIKSLFDRRSLVLLGDPGSGKSTIVSYISWQLCRRGRPEVPDNPWQTAFKDVIPLPVVLRDLSLRSDLTWEGLLEAFLEQKLGTLLGRTALLDALRNGRALLLLDGLDEVGHLAVRQRLRDAVHAGMMEFPNARWVLTSRVVGYDQVPFHFRHERTRNETEDIHETRKKSHRIKTADVLYLSPFDDGQIEAFARNWYRLHEKSLGKADESTRDFVVAVQENEGTKRLARIPYLITLMALIHQKHSALPHGRTELYDRISDAYLELIDARRKLNHLPYSLIQKRRWLADIAYRMQLRRARISATGSGNEVLAQKEDVQRWLRSAMQGTGERHSQEEAVELIEYFAKRSGLLLPRGEKKFAFMHLSLQEYFAACYLERRLSWSPFAKKTLTDPSKKQLTSWAGQAAWRETFVLLFELFSERSPHETESFLRYLFGRRLEEDARGKEREALQLLAEVISNPFVHLPADTRREMRGRCWRWMFKHAQRVSTGAGVRILLREAQSDLAAAWKAAGISPQELAKITVLDLSGCSGLTDLRPLRQLRGLEELILERCSNVQDLSPLSTLQHLSVLVLGAPADLQALSELTELKTIHLHFQTETPVDLTPLFDLEKLVHVCARYGPGFDVTEETLGSVARVKSPGIRELINTINELRKDNSEKEAILSVLGDGSGVPFSELASGVSDVGRTALRRILLRLKQQGLIRKEGQGVSERWYVIEQTAVTH